MLLALDSEALTIGPISEVRFVLIVILYYSETSSLTVPSCKGWASSLAFERNHFYGSFSRIAIRYFLSIDSHLHSGIPKRQEISGQLSRQLQIFPGKENTRSDGILILDELPDIRVRASPAHKILLHFLSTITGFAVWGRWVSGASCARTIDLTREAAQIQSHNYYVNLHHIVPVASIVWSTTTMQSATRTVL